MNNGSRNGTEHSYLMSPVFNSTGGGTITFNAGLIMNGTIMTENIWRYPIMAVVIGVY